MKRYRVIAIVGALALLAAACQSAPATAVQVAPPDVPATQAVEVTRQEGAPAPISEQGAPVEQEPAAPVVVRQGLAATNPTDVNLANGTPTLVEFFAFW